MVEGNKESNVSKDEQESSEQYQALKENLTVGSNNHPPIIQKPSEKKEEKTSVAERIFYIILGIIGLAIAIPFLLLLTCFALMSAG